MARIGSLNMVIADPFGSNKKATQLRAILAGYSLGSLD